MFNKRYKSHQCVPHEGGFFIVGIGDIFPTPIDLRDHPMLLHFLVLVHALDLEPSPLPVVQQAVWDSIAFTLPHHL